MAVDWRRPGLHLAVLLYGTGLGVLLTIPLIGIVALAMMLVPAVGIVLGSMPPGIGILVFLVVSWCSGLIVTYAIVARMLK